MTNVISLAFTDAQLQAVDTALNELEAQFAGLVSLTAQEKLALKKMGERSEAFCRQALRALDQNRQIVPPNLPLARGVADLGTLDQLRPRLMRLLRLAERAKDSDTALGASVMDVALQSYGLLKLRGHGEGLKTLRHDLAGRFRKVRRANSREEPGPGENGTGTRPN
jgi:hypothetical protein